MGKAIISLTLAQIEVKPQVRATFNEEAIEGLAASIKSCGQLQPIRVQNVAAGKFLVIDGERRLRACQFLHRETIDAIVEESPLAARDFHIQQLAANVHSESLTPIEKAHAFAKAMELGSCTATEAAKQIGISNATATRLVAMLALPDSIRQRVHAGSIPFSAAYELSKVTDPQAQSRAAEQIEKGELTRDGLAAARKRTKRASDESEQKIVRSVAVLDGGRSVTVSSAGNTLEAFIETLEECLKRARTEAKTGMSLPTFLKVQRDRSAAQLAEQS